MNQTLGPSGVTTVSFVRAAPADVWERAVSPKGINHELMPLVRMTVPRRLRDMSFDEVPLGRRICRSWILLLGIVPVEYDDVCLAERGPGYRFLERSKMFAMKVWEHERSVEAGPDAGSTITDRIYFKPRAVLKRIPGSGAIANAIVAAIFRHRHRRLTRYHGELSVPE